MSDEKGLYLHTLSVRIWHWLQALAIILLLLTGVRIRFAESMAFLTMGQAVRLHNAVALFFILISASWFFSQLLTGAIAGYFSNPLTLLPNIFKQTKYYAWGFFRGEPNPHKATPKRKFNPLQQVTYAALMFVILPAQAASGIVLWALEYFHEHSLVLGGVKIIDTVHVFLSYVLVLFLIVHGYLITLGKTPTAHFKAMIHGYDEHD
jgi:thiosulfate reductase cytochrome b subunit